MPRVVLQSWLESLVSADHFQRLGWVVVHSLWQAAAVAAVLAVALRIVPRRSAAALQARYVLAALALALLPAASVVTYGLVGAPAAARPAALGVAAGAAVPSGHVLALPAAVAAAVDRDRAVSGAQAVTSAPASDDVRAAVALLARRAAAALSPWLSWCAAIWLVGAGAAAGRLGVGWWLTRWLVAEATAPAAAWWQARVDRWHDALGITRRVRLLASARIDVPAVVGWLEPVVIWPLAALTGMPTDQIDAILAHELAHVRRHDVFVNLLQSCIETLFFHHPAAWWISAQVRAEREHCADDLAVRVLVARRAGSRLSYATALVALEERRRVTALAVAADGGSLVDRVRRLAGIEPAAGHPATLAAAVLALVVIAASVATVATGGHEARAETAEMPADTDRIERLTPQQAEALVAGFKGGFLNLDALTTLDADTARALAGFKGDRLDLGVPTLSADVAQALAGFKGQALVLNGLTTLSADSAAKLAGLRGGLYFFRLTTLSADAAQALAGFRGALHLSRLTRLDADVARALATYEGDVLALDGLATPDADTVRAIGECKAQNLFLCGLTTLSADTAQALAGFKGVRLRLDGLTTLDADAAQALAGLKARAVDLDGLTTLSVEAAEALARYEGELLTFDRLTTLSADAAQALAGFRGTLSLDGLTALDARTAQALAEFKGHWLHLRGVATLSAGAAAALADIGGNWAGELPGITAFESPDSVAVAETLATRAGRLSLPGLRKISPKTLAALIEKRDVDIPPIKTLVLIPEPDGSVTEDFIAPEWLESRQRR